MALKVKIKYNGKTTELASGKKALLACRGKNMLSDIEVVFENIVEGTFSIENGGGNNSPYTFIIGMTWAEYVASEYNEHFYIEDGTVYFNYSAYGNDYSEDTPVSDGASPSATITDGFCYYCEDY